jgi:predicted nucleotidyltransferase
MAVDLKTILYVVSEYVNYVRDELSVHKVLLYGSYAKGTATELSDVDVCFFIANINDENWMDIMVKLRMIFLNFNDIFIYPIVFNDSDIFEDNSFIN